MFFLIFILISITTFSQNEGCLNYSLKAQDLIRNYKFIEAEKILEESTKICDFKDFYNIYYMLSQVYLWRENFEKAKPIIEKITKEAEYKLTQAGVGAALGKSRALYVIYLSYANNSKEMEKEILNFNDLNFKTQEAIFNYLLRKNDKRFFEYYGIRKQYKGDMAPLLCKVYCKKNNIIKDCPCNEPFEKEIEGGIYKIYKNYLDGESLNSLKTKVEEQYKEAPGIKKEIFEVLKISKEK